MHERPTGYEPHRHLTGDVTRLYLTLLGREPDNGGLNHFTNALRTRGMSMLDVRETMIRSEEGTNRLNGLVATGNRGEAVNIMYQGLLARNVHDDVVGRSVYVETERSITDIRDEILVSGEYQQRREVGNQIVQFYFDLLQRPADDDGLNHYIRQVLGNALSVEQVRNTIDGSEEARIARTATPLTEWQRFQEEQQRQAQERTRQQTESNEQREVAARERELQREFDKAHMGERGIRSCQELQQEIRERQLDQIARSIQQDWQSQTQHQVILEEVQLPDVSLLAIDESIQDNSCVLLRVAYTHPDGKEVTERIDVEDYSAGEHTQVTERIDRTEEIFLGLGRFSDTYYTRGARNRFTEGERAYIIGEKVGDTIQNRVVVPLKSSDAQNQFFQQLGYIAQETSPNTVIPQANERIARIGKGWR